ncbi:unnamed protein product [Lathyrus oleraceus]|uniref:Protein LAZY 1-like n=1 Tax=Pisum sativum TaxID=3888 RepID=A0A9D5B5Z3_PEA|nr:protein LAZY 1-like [Pisum sativum]KAI5431570.1 hypothetical protein KIW84_035671 [Pisum sativum]
MKLLGWMHRKFRQNSSGDPFKDLVIGNSCNCLSGQPSLDEEHNYHQKPNFGIKFTKKPQTNTFRKSFAGLESTREHHEEDFGRESQDDTMFDLFPGFLAIGTLGSETPTFPNSSVQTITENENEDEVTENDLKLINDELEKVLVAETKDDVISYDSSSRNSHVSTGRSSHVSIITISGKPIEGSGTGTATTLTRDSYSNAVCPLQGYLFGTTVEYSETAAASVGGNRKEHRTSLGELFQRSKMAEESCFGKDDKRDAEKYSAMNLVKEKVKKRMFHSCSKNSSSIIGGNGDSASAETKLNKILHMFRKKVHPESSTTGHKSGKHKKNESKKKIMNDGGFNKGYLVHPDEDSSSYREHWIKTDADYLVLEL